MDLREKLKKIKMGEETVVLVSGLVSNSRMMAEAIKESMNVDKK